MTRQMQKQNRGQSSKGSLMATLSVMAFALSTFFLAEMDGMMHMAGGWSGFKQTMESFFKNGLGGEGMAGVGIAIAAIGIAAAVISFVVHKFNPQSRMPGWITCLLIGVIGAIAMGGLEKPLALVTKIRDILWSWIGI